MEYKHKTSMLINDLADIDQWDAIEHIQELVHHVAALQSRLESLEKDAARWRAATRDTEINDIAVCSFDKHGDDKIVMGDEADSIIDAAMQARKGGE